MSIVSNCCTASKWGSGEGDICSNCKEHAEFYDDEVLYINDLIEGQEYRVIETLLLTDHHAFMAITLPIGYILTYKGRKNDYLMFESKDGMAIVIAISYFEDMHQLEEMPIFDDEF